MATRCRFMPALLTVALVAAPAFPAQAQVRGQVSRKAASPITQPSPLKVTAPAGGENVLQGSCILISWTRDLTPGKVPIPAGRVNLYLVREGKDVSSLAEQQPGVGSWSWRVPATQPPGKYAIAVRPVAGGTPATSTVFSVLPSPPGRPGGTANAPTIPNVTGYSPPGRGYLGMTITFIGRDLDPCRFTARLGATTLDITSRSTGRMEAKLPSRGMTGDLVVSHGTPATEYVLQHGYRVAGDAVITEVQPRTFARGDTVRLIGTDLDGASPFGWGSGGGAGSTIKYYVRLGDAPQSGVGSNYVQVPEGRDAVTGRAVSGWQVGADGASASFRAGDVFARDAGGLMRPVSPQPGSLSGQLQLLRAGSNVTPVTGPTATWTPSVLRVSKLVPPWRPLPDVDFVLTKPGGEPSVSVEGSGLDGATASLGSASLRLSANPDGLWATFYVPYTALSNHVVFTKGTASATSPRPLKVVPCPRMLDTGTEAVAIPLGTEFEIKGWDLLPGNEVPGLAYEFRLLNDLNSLTACKLEYSLLSHTASSIRFVVKSTAPLPQNCRATTLFGGSPGTYLTMRIVARCAGQEQELWRRPFYLVAP